MKKFLRKKPVMITFVALAIVFIAVYIGMLVRPVSYGFNYVYNTSYTMLGKKVESTTKINLLSDKVARKTVIDEKEGEDTETIVRDYWIYRDGEKVYIIAYKELVKTKGLTEEEKVEIKEEIEALKIDKKGYEAKIKTIKDAKAQGDLQYLAALGINTIGSYEVSGIYKLVLRDSKTKEETIARNNQAIIFTAVHGVVTVVLTTFATLSVVFFVTKKKK